MSGILNEQGGGEELVDYEEDEQQQNQIEIKEKNIGEEIIIGRGNYVGIHSSGFRDFFLKPELVRAIGDAGFEHPSEVQHETIPHAITGSDILCQAKSGMGKTAVFVLSILQQINIDNYSSNININNNISNSNDSNDNDCNDNDCNKNDISNNIVNNNNCNNNNNDNSNDNIIKNNDNNKNKNINDDHKNKKNNSNNININNNTNQTTNNKNNNNNNKNNNNDNNNTYGIICLGIAHTRELAFQIKNEFDRFSKYIKGIKCEVIYGGVNIQKNINMLKDNKTCPHILIGTPGRLLALIKMKVLNVSKIKHFVLDECDKCLEKIDMRKDVQEIFMNTMKKKQVMFFSATMNKEIRGICKKFMQHPIEIFIDNESKLTLHGLLQYYIQLQESEKNRKLNDLLDSLEFNQVIIFVKSVTRAQALDALLTECNFPSFAIHAALPQEERINRYQQFKNFEKRIMVATDLFGRGIDIERVNIVINYDMPDSSDAYLHRVGRAGRFGTKGLAITFVASQEDTNALNDVQTRFEVHIPQMPATIDTSQYINQ